MNIARNLARLLFLLLAPAIPAHAGILQRGKVQLICHRTANRDMPENTLESLALAARMGCNIVEIDIRKGAPAPGFLLSLLHDNDPDVLIAWAIEKIKVLRFQPWTN